MADLESDVIDWIAQVTGGEEVSARLVASGGRLGYQVDVVKAGKQIPLFLQRGRMPGWGQFSPLEKEAEVFLALEAIGVTVPHVWGASNESNVLLMDRLEGAVWFQEPPDAQQRVRIAQDYIRQIAKWHGASAAEMNLPSFKPIKSVKEHQRDQLAGIRREFEEADAKSPIDAIARATLEFLEKKTPDYDGPPVLCQGDTGPGNFLYRDDKVIGVIDWELAHIGDPMDDIAWLSWRATQHGFPDFPARLREYEQLSGIEVVVERVYYYRVNACARLGPWFGLADMGQAADLRRRSGAQQAEDTDRSADGSQMIMSMLHRRMRLEALGAALGMRLPPRLVADEAKTHEHSAMYDNMLRQLQVMVPLIADKKASSLAKGVARQLKYLKEVDRYHTHFEQQELTDIARLLGRKVQSLEEGRPALAKAAREENVSFEGYFLYHWNRMVRDDHMMREASGRLFERGWPALV